MSYSKEIKKTDRADMSYCKEGRKNKYRADMLYNEGWKKSVVCNSFIHKHRETLYVLSAS